MRNSALIVIGTFAIVASFANAASSLAKEINCYGRQYPAKAIVIHARSALVEVDLGFGLTYRGIVELSDTTEPTKPIEEWYGKASEALRTKIGGKSIILCINSGGSKHARFFVDGEDINRWMLEKGYLPPIIIKENITTNF